MSFEIFGLNLTEPNFPIKSNDFPVDALKTEYFSDGFKKIVLEQKIRRCEMFNHTEEVNYPSRINLTAVTNHRQYTFSNNEKIFALLVNFPCAYKDTGNYISYNNRWFKGLLILSLKSRISYSNAYLGSSSLVNSFNLNQNTGEITSYNFPDDTTFTDDLYSGNTLNFTSLATYKDTFINNIITINSLPESEYFANKIWSDIENFCNKITDTENGTNNVYCNGFYDLHSEINRNGLYTYSYYTTIPVYNVNQYDSCKNYLTKGTESIFDGTGTPENLEDIIISTQDIKLNTDWSIYLQTGTMQTIFTWNTKIFNEENIETRNAIAAFYDDEKNIVKSVPYNQKQVTFNIDELPSYLKKQYKDNGYYNVNFRIINNDKISSLCYAKIEPVITEYGVNEPNDGSTITLNYNKYPDVDTDYDGNKDSTDDDIINGSTIGGGESSYNALNVISRTYYITTSNLRSLSQFLWSDNFTKNIKLLTNDPIENIVSCKMLPFILHGSESTVVCGNVDTGVNAESIANNCYQVLGSINIPSYYNNFLDYAPYTKLTIFLPFIGFKELDCNLYIGKPLTVAYIHDIITGTCKAMLYSDNIYVQSFDGISGIDIPLTASNNSQISNAFIGSAVGSVAQFFGDPIGGLLSLGKATVSSALATQHYSTQGSYSPSCGAYETHVCYIIVDRPSMQYSKTYNHDYGRPCNLSQTIGNLKGFTKMCGNIDCSGISCTENEKEMIRQLLTSGIYV